MQNIKVEIISGNEFEIIYEYGMTGEMTSGIMSESGSVDAPAGVYPLMDLTDHDYPIVTAAMRAYGWEWTPQNVWFPPLSDTEPVD